MIVILILSEDEFFCKMIHEVVIKNVTWYQHDRPISEISLGGLAIAVFAKTIHTNTVKTRVNFAKLMFVKSEFRTVICTLIAWQHWPTCPPHSSIYLHTSHKSSSDFWKR
jgi:hypothetical protein